MAQSYLTDGDWLALQVKPRHEQRTALFMREKGYRELVPTYLCRRRWSDREKDIELPLFPGYVFCCFDTQNPASLLSTPGICRIVGRVDVREIEALQHLVSSGHGAEPWPYISAGCAISVQAGPLAGLEGVVLAVNGRHRLIISVTLLRRSVAVEIDPRWVAPAAVRGATIGGRARS